MFRKKSYDSYSKELWILHAQQIIIKRYQIEKVLFQVVLERAEHTELFELLLAQVTFARHENDVKLFHVVLEVCLTFDFCKKIQ
jgi:hypothetical protein